MPVCQPASLSFVLIWCFHLFLFVSCDLGIGLKYTGIEDYITGLWLYELNVYSMWDKTTNYFLAFAFVSSHYACSQKLYEWTKELSVTGVWKLVQFKNWYKVSVSFIGTKIRLLIFHIFIVVSVWFTMLGNGNLNKFYWILSPIGLLLHFWWGHLSLLIMY